MPNIEPEPNQFKNEDNQIEEPNVILETQKEHKDWYNVNQMGRQGNRPVNVPREIKKEKGTHKRSSSKGR